MGMLHIFHYLDKIHSYISYKKFYLCKKGIFQDIWNIFLLQDYVPENNSSNTYCHIQDKFYNLNYIICINLLLEENQVGNVGIQLVKGTIGKLLGKKQQNLWMIQAEYIELHLQFLLLMVCMDQTILVGEQIHQNTLNIYLLCYISCNDFCIYCIIYHFINH